MKSKIEGPWKPSRRIWTLPGDGADREAADGEVGVALVEVVAAVGDARRVARDVEDVHRLLVLDEGLGEGLDGERQIADRRVEAGAGHGVGGAVAAVELGGNIERRDPHLHQFLEVHVGHVFRQFCRRRCVGDWFGSRGGSGKLDFGKRVQVPRYKQLRLADRGRG